MTVKQKKVKIALRRYYQYLDLCFKYIALSIIEVSDKEFTRMYLTRNIYRQAFYNHNGFKKWLLDKNHKCSKHPKLSPTDNAFYIVAERLKNEILESEK